MKYARILFLLAAGLFAFASAIATASAQAVISGNYYEENKNGDCQGIAGCVVVFSAAPQNVFITDVSCEILTANSGVAYRVMLGVSDSANGTFAPRRPEYFIPASVAANVWTVRSKAGFLFGTGRWPQIVVTVNNSIGMTINCKISGTFVVP